MTPESIPKFLSPINDSPESLSRIRLYLGSMGRVEILMKEWCEDKEMRDRGKWGSPPSILFGGQVEFWVLGSPPSIFFGGRVEFWVLSSGLGVRGFGDQSDNRQLTTSNSQLPTALTSSPPAPYTPSESFLPFLLSANCHLHLVQYY